MTSTPYAADAHPYLRAASARLRHHTRATSAVAADRVHLDVLHAHLTALHHLIDQIGEASRPAHPTAGRHLGTAHLRLWQATAAVHDAFHLLPTAPDSTGGTPCEPERLPEGPPVLTICQRHLTSSHAIRRKTTPTDLNAPLHGHTRTTGCAI